MTADSIATAREAQRRERDEVYRLTGLRIVDDPIPARAVRAHCPRPGCHYVASARSEGRALRSLATHLVLAHMKRGDC